MIEIRYDGFGNIGSSLMGTHQLFTPDPVRTLGKALRGRYLKCVAVQEFNINTFTVYSPFNVIYSFDREKRSVSTNGDNVLGKCDFYDDGTIELQIMPQYMFIADQDVLIQQLPPLLTAPVHGTYVAAAEFNIAKWYRPINSTFIIGPEIDRLEIREGDPLFSIRFVTPNNEPVKLIRSGMTDTEIKLITACLGTTNVKMGSRLSTLYSHFIRLKDAWMPKKSKCPFRRNNK
jgi:hypothetical protein